MDKKQDLISSEHPRYPARFLAAILVFLYFGAMIILFRSGLEAVFEPPLLLLVLNTIFAGLIPIAVSIIAARAYLFSGLNSLLFMGCGMMTFGCGAAMAGWLIDGQQVPNVNVTIMNVGALLGSAFHAVGAILALQNKIPETKPKRRQFKLVLAYSGMFFAVLFFTLATRRGITPAFFVQGAGPTLLRQFVLGTAVLLFLLSALVSMIMFAKRRTPFHYWYSLALIMIALGLTAFFIQKLVGSPIGWLGRLGEYIGGIFALAAILVIARSSRLKRVAMPSAVTDLFQYSKASYQTLIETMTDPIVSFDQDGKILQWNSAAEKVFGYGQSEAIGASLFHLVINETSLERFREEVICLTANADQKKVRPPVEITGKTKAGSVIPMEVATSAIMPSWDQWSFISVFRDITERKKAESEVRNLNAKLEQLVRERTQALQENQANLQAALTSMTDAVFISDAEGRFIEFNEAFATFHKFRNKEECAKTLAEYPAFLDVFLPNGDPAPLEQWAVPRALRGETVTNAEYTLRRKDTGETWVGSYSFSPIRDKEGEIVGSVVVGRDITERKQAEAALRYTQTLLQSVTEDTSDAIYVKDIQGRYLIFNATAARITGKPREEVLGKDDTALFAPDEACRVMEGDRRVMASGSTQTYEEIVTSGGMTRTFLSAKGPMCDAQGKVIGLFGIARDITERKRAEEQVIKLLAESNQARRKLLSIIEDQARAEDDLKRLATAIEQAAEVIVITDAQGLIKYVNPAFEAVTGYTRKESLGQNPRILSSGQQDAAFYRELWTTISSGKTWQGRFVNRNKSGALYTEDATISPVRDTAGAIINYVAVKRDITAELNIQVQLNQAQKMESVGMLAGGVAHDFNNILQIILGNVELVLARTNPDNPLHHDLEEVQSAGWRGVDLTRQLLGFARKQVIAPRTIDLNEAVEGMLKMLRRLIGENIKLAWTPRTGLWPIRMDPGQVDQILLNLCVNARDVITGVGMVHIATENVRVDEFHTALKEGVAPGNYVLLTVSDTGCGMNKETLGKIFEPFFTTKAVGKGTGLGLATVYGIVQQNQGHIGVYSELGKGSTFHIYLPLHVGKDAVPAAEGPQKSLARGTETVLLVEDDAAILDMSGRFLRSLGYSVLEAGTPEVALRLAEEHADKIRLLVTDVVMPGMSGIELAGLLKARHPGLKCLFMSGFTTDIVARQGIMDGSDHFIQKPFSTADLADKVREALAVTRELPA